MQFFDRTRFRMLSRAVVNAYGLFHRNKQAAQAEAAVPLPAKTITLPAPELHGEVPLEKVLAARRSVREFSPIPISEQQISQLLWAAQGISHDGWRRTAPSAGAAYPLEVYVSLPDGFYRYQPQRHQLELHFESDLRSALYCAAQWRGSIRHAAAVFVIAAVYERVARQYGEERGPLYVHLEAGHAAQNLLLQATALGLASVPIGGFYDDQVEKALSLPEDHEPIYLIAVGSSEKPSGLHG